MRWRLLIALGLLVGVGCGVDDGPASPPDPSVLGTSVEGEQPAPTIGSAVSTERP